MGMLTTLSKPMNQMDLKLSCTDDAQMISQLQDEIILKFSDLITDIEQEKLPESLLKLEIHKLVEAHKGIFNIEYIKQQLFDRLFGYGFLQSLIEDESISDIDILRFNYILIKREGKLILSDLKFEDEATFERYCRLVVIRNGGMLNEVDSHCRVSDIKYALRINATIKPRNTSGATLSIRKHPKECYTLESLVGKGFMTQSQKNKLIEYNQQKKNIIICGKGGSGKTTLLRSLMSTVDEFERVLICESDQEVYPQQPNVISQCIKKDYLGGSKRNLEMLIKDGLTMSLDTYCIGEITGTEAWDLIQAGHTDHRILSTVHANSPEDLFLRLLAMIETRTRLSESTLLRMITNSIDIIVYIKTFKISRITEVCAFDDKKKMSILKDIL